MLTYGISHEQFTSSIHWNYAKSVLILVICQSGGLLKIQMKVTKLGTITFKIGLWAKQVYQMPPIMPSLESWLKILVYLAAKFSSIRILWMNALHMRLESTSVTERMFSWDTTPCVLLWIQAVTHLSWIRTVRRSVVSGGHACCPWAGFTPVQYKKKLMRSIHGNKSVTCTITDSDLLSSKYSILNWR